MVSNPLKWLTVTNAFGTVVFCSAKELFISILP